MNEQSGRSDQLEVYEPSFTWFIIGYIFYPIISVFYYLYKYITLKPAFFIKTSTIIKKRDRTIVEEDWKEVLIDRDLNTWEIERIKSARKKASLYTNSLCNSNHCICYSWNNGEVKFSIFFSKPYLCVWKRN